MLGERVLVQDALLGVCAFAQGTKSPPASFQAPPVQTAPQVFEKAASGGDSSVPPCARDP